jgi:hypothetical protein
MSIFDISYTSKPILDAYLKRLKLSQENPTLNYLNALIDTHQSLVPFENLTRIRDFKEKPLRFPTIEESLQQIIEGHGGVCWSLARAFKWLLKELGFKTEYLYMEPGHVCLKVTLDQEYYVDVGYGAPFFRAMPLNETFHVQSASEDFSYDVKGTFVDVKRTPGPQKKLHLIPYSPEQIEAEFLRGNVWGQNRFLSETVISKYINHSLVRLYGSVLTDFRSGQRVEKEVSLEEMNKILTLIFEIDPELYHQARKWLL